MSKLFSFDTDRHLGTLVGLEVKTAVKGFLKESPDPDALFKKKMTTKSKSQRFSSFIRLKILHRQFSSGTVPGLPVIVRSARFLYGRYRSLRKYLPENS